MKEREQERSCVVMGTTGLEQGLCSGWLEKEYCYRNVPVTSADMQLQRWSILLLLPQMFCAVFSQPEHHFPHEGPVWVHDLYACTCGAVVF